MAVGLADIARRRQANPLAVLSMVVAAVVLAVLFRPLTLHPLEAWAAGVFMRLPVVEREATQHQVQARQAATAMLFPTLAALVAAVVVPTLQALVPLVALVARAAAVAAAVGRRPMAPTVALVVLAGAVKCGFIGGEHENRSH